MLTRPRPPFPHFSLLKKTRRFCRWLACFFFVTQMAFLCIFAPRSRSDNSSCFGRIQELDSDSARKCGYFYPINICHKHLKEKQEVNKLFCCFPFKNGDCSKTRIKCPRRFFKVFNEYGDKQGTLICHKHLEEADTSDIITSSALYEPPHSRKVRINFILSFSFIGKTYCMIFMKIIIDSDWLRAVQITFNW